MTYCIHCQTELPGGARYCFSCGKAVAQIHVVSPSWQLPVKTESLSRRVMDLELYREEQPDHDQEYLRITPSLVTAVPEAAALVLYGNASMQGESISLITDMYSSPEVELKHSALFATIIPRQVKGKTYYVAIFPRIYFFTCDGKKTDITHASCALEGLPRLGSGSMVRKLEPVTLYPGLVTEVDWSKEYYKGMFGRGL